MLFLSCGFHEIFCVALGISSVIFVLFLILNRETSCQLVFKRVFLICLLPCILFILLDLISLYVYFDNRTLFFVKSGHGYSLLALLDSIWVSFCGAATAFFFPWVVELKKDFTGILVWYFKPYSLACIVAGLLYLTLILNIFKRYISVTIKGKPSLNKVVCFILFLSLFLSYVLLIGVGRVYVRSVVYIQKTTYYFSFFSFFSIVFVAIWITRFNDKKHMIWRFIFMLILSTLIAVNLIKLIPELFDEYRAHKKLGVNHAVLYDYFNSHKNVCLVGPLPESSRAFFGILTC